MNKKITFKEWASSFFQGIWQALCWVGRAFNPMNKTPFWRVIWAAITICIIAFTGMLGYAFYDEFYARRERARWYDQPISEKIYFHNGGKGKGFVYRYDHGDKTKIIKGIDWVVKSLDGDSLAVFAKDGKRGYLNRYTGKVIIPAQYDAAWTFTDGVAGVCKNDSVWFIDSNGEPINSRKFKRIPGYNDYCYHGGHVKMPHGEKYGFVTKEGNWTNQYYDNVEIVARDMWRVTENGTLGVLSDSLTCVVPIEYRSISVGYMNGIIATTGDNIQKLFDFDGNIINDFVIDGVELLAYPSDEFDDEGNRINKAANVNAYYVNDQRGLISKDGKPITLTKYRDIRALTADTYECEYYTGAGSVSEIINSKGDVVSVHP